MTIVYLYTPVTGNFYTHSQIYDDGVYERDQILKFYDTNENVPIDLDDRCQVWANHFNLPVELVYPDKTRYYYPEDKIDV